MYRDNNIILIIMTLIVFINSGGFPIPNENMGLVNTIILYSLIFILNALLGLMLSVPLILLKDVYIGMKDNRWIYVF